MLLFEVGAELLGSSARQDSAEVRSRALTSFSVLLSSLRLPAISDPERGQSQLSSRRLVKGFLDGSQRSFHGASSPKLRVTSFPLLPRITSRGFARKTNRQNPCLVLGPRPTAAGHPRVLACERQGHPRRLLAASTEMAHRPPGTVPEPRYRRDCSPPLPQACFLRDDNVGILHKILKIDSCSRDCSPFSFSALNLMLRRGPPCTLRSWEPGYYGCISRMHGGWISLVSGMEGLEPPISCSSPTVCLPPRRH